jgi:hypothetical protein
LWRRQQGRQEHAVGAVLGVDVAPFRSEQCEPAVLDCVEDACPAR